jgi:glycosyltransferase involved in cell wall biosynthesis
LSEQQPDRVRVTFIVGSLDIGGAERQLVRLANALDRSRFEPAILTWFGGGVLEKELAPDVPVVKLGLGRVRLARGPAKILLALNILRALFRELRALGPDVVDAYMFTAYVLGALAAWTVRVPVIIASRRGLVSYATYPARWRLVARLANQVIDLHLCNSEAVRRWAIEKERLPESRTAVIHNGLDLPAPSALELDPAWRRNAGGTLAVMIANFHGYKAHSMVLDAVAKLRRDHPEFKLVLFGDGDERENLQRQAAALALGTGVVFAGARPDAAEFLPAFDLSILASDEEGFPNVVMESMAAAVPVVATDVGGVPELVDDGVEGKLVPVRDPDALAAAIGWMIEHPAERRAMGEAGRRRIREHFSVAGMVSAHEELFTRLLGRHATVRSQPVEAG